MEEFCGDYKYIIIYRETLVGSSATRAPPRTKKQIWTCVRILGGARELFFFLLAEGRATCAGAMFGPRLRQSTEEDANLTFILLIFFKISEKLV